MGVFVVRGELDILLRAAALGWLGLSANTFLARSTEILPTKIGTLTEDLFNNLLVANNVANAIDHHASIHLDLDGTGIAVTINHGDAAVAGAVLLYRLGYCLSNGICMAGW